MAGSSKNQALPWKLPALKTSEFGKLGPGFGFGAGCGVGLGVGVMGGAGLGFGFPGVKFGVGAGAGCGIGIGYGYGVGLGIAYDENGKHSNLEKSLRKAEVTKGDEVGALIDNLINNVGQVIDNVYRNSKKN